MLSISLSAPKLATKHIVVMGLLMAMQMVLRRFSIGPEFVKISPAVFATILMGYYLGPWWAATAAALNDQLYTVMMGGPNFLGFTLSAALGAFIYGMFFYRKQVTLPRAIVAVFLVLAIVNVFMNTVWLNMMGMPWQAYIWIRTIKNLVMWPIQTALVFVTLRGVQRIRPNL